MPCTKKYEASTLHISRHIMGDKTAYILRGKYSYNNKESNNNMSYQQAYTYKVHLMALTVFMNKYYTYTVSLEFLNPIIDMSHYSSSDISTDVFLVKRIVGPYC